MGRPGAADRVLPEVSVRVSVPVMGGRGPRGEDKVWVSFPGLRVHPGQVVVSHG